MAPSRTLRVDRNGRALSGRSPGWARLGTRRGPACGPQAAPGADAVQANLPAGGVVAGGTSPWTRPAGRRAGLGCRRHSWRQSAWGWAARPSHDLRRHPGPWRDADGYFRERLGAEIRVVGRRMPRHHGPAAGGAMLRRGSTRCA